MDDIYNNRIPRLRHFCAPVPCAYQFRHVRDSARNLERRLLADALPLTGPQVALLRPRNSFDLGNQHSCSSQISGFELLNARFAARASVRQGQNSFVQTT
jgi:hypothetical protein